MKKIIYISILAFLMTSCFKEEDKRPINTEASESMPLGEDYGNVFYYNLSTQTVVAQNRWYDWNLAFYAQDDDYFIRLNDAANMKAYKASSSNFEEVKEVDTQADFLIDSPLGERSKIALDYKETSTKGDTTFYDNDVYVLLIGTDALGEGMGYKKVQLLYTYLNQYTIRHANLDGTEDKVATIFKNVTLNYIHFSFLQNDMVEIEPDKTTWDIAFSRSTDMAVTNDFVDTIFDYSVTSVLLNPYFSEAYKETDMGYDEFSSNNIKRSNFTNQRNIIGFNWKAFDLNNINYSVRDNEIYILKDINDFYYKINFLSFLDPETNIKGTISFKYEIIK